MRLLLSIIVLFFIHLKIFSQQLVVKGKIVDAKTHTPIPDTNIYNPTDHTGTISDFNGEFQVRAVAGDTLVFSSLGYKTKKQKIDKAKLFIELTTSSFELDEVQIIAKANINDIDLRKAVGTVTTIPIGKIKDRPVVNMIEALQGQVAGVHIKSSGELGKPLQIRIRGTSTLPIKTKDIAPEDRFTIDNRANQPLYVLDGQVISAASFAALNINNIKEVKVLKDAAANALYGVKAANGVIEITGKRGINGETQYSVSFQKGITLKGEPSIAMMGTREKLEFERLSKNINTPGYNLSEEYFRKLFPNDPKLEERITRGKEKLDSLKKINTNWFDELTRIDTYQSYNLSIRGGNEKNRFYISGNFTQQGGKFEGNKIHRFTGRLNYEYNLLKDVHIMFNAGFGVSENTTPNSSSYTPSQLIYELNPYEQPNNIGELISYPGRTFSDLVNQYSKTADENRFNFSGNLFAKFSKNLQLSSVIGIDYVYQGALAIVPKNAFSEITSGVPENERGKATKNKTMGTNFSTNTRLNYQQLFGRHTISASANVDYYRNGSDFIGITGYGLPSNLHSGAGINNDIEGARRSRTASKKTTEAQLGFGFSSLYNWNDKLEWYGSYKIDGSSLLPSDKRWNTFWATGIGYTVSEESFFKNKLIRYLKFRGSYGVTASLAGITASLAVPTFSYGDDGYLGIREFYLQSLFNDKLRPEKNTSVNVGMNIGIGSNVNISLDVYHRRTDDMLLTVPVAPSNGFSEQLRNVGILENKGIEMSVNATLINTDTFTWSTSGNLSYNKNEIIDLYEGTELTLSNNPFPDYKEGESADLIYGLVNLGIFPADGTPRYRRVDGSQFHGNLEKPNSEDFVVLGNATPPFTGGWFNSLRYKDWQLSFDLYFNFGGKAVYNNQSVVLVDDDTNKNAVRGQLQQTWFEPGDEGRLYPSLTLGTGNIFENLSYASDRTVGRTDFIRLNNIMLSHQFNTRSLGAFGKNIDNLRMYVQLKNIATWSNFGGGDPESANLVGSVQPIITIGTNLSF